MNPEEYYEVNFEGLPSPLHLYSGLGQGNFASKNNKGGKSYPQKAALQSLTKIKLLKSLGIKEYLIPPQNRLSNLTINPKYFEQEEKLRQLISSSNMWVANAATMSPSLDCKDNKTHFTIANLLSNPHRALESDYTQRFFEKIFEDSNINIHPPLREFDEGGANHTRLCPQYNSEGLEIFVYGFDDNPQISPIIRARQSKKACEQIIENHQIKNHLIIKQNPEAIAKGVFHNDVISTGNLNFFMYHQKAFETNAIEQIHHQYKKIFGHDLIDLEISELSIEDCVKSYIFNSQIVGSNSMTMLAPAECKENQIIKDFIEKKIIQNPKIPINQVLFLDLEQSMQNGGGPACLRLRAVLKQEEINSIKAKIEFNDELFASLESWIEKYYPESFELNDLRDKDFLEQIQQAYKALDKMIELS